MKITALKVSCSWGPGKAGRFLGVLARCDKAALRKSGRAEIDLDCACVFHAGMNKQSFSFLQLHERASRSKFMEAAILSLPVIHSRDAGFLNQFADRSPGLKIG
jgi:hypothetical protein